MYLRKSVTPNWKYNNRSTKTKTEGDIGTIQYKWKPLSHNRKNRKGKEQIRNTKSNGKQGLKW